MFHVRLLSVGLQYVTFRLIKHMVGGRISGVRIIKFQIRGIPRPQLLDPQTVDRVRKQQQLMRQQLIIIIIIIIN